SQNERKPEPALLRPVPFWKRRWVYATFATGAAAAVLLMTVAVPSMLRSRQAMSRPELMVGLPAPASSSASANAMIGEPVERAKQTGSPDPSTTSLYAETEKRQAAEKVESEVRPSLDQQAQAYTGSPKLEVGRDNLTAAVRDEAAQEKDVQAKAK